MAAMESVERLNESLYDPAFVEFYKRQKFQPHLTIAEFASEGYGENSREVPLFNPVTILIRPATATAKRVRFTIQYPSDKQWYERLLYQVARALNSTTGIDLLYGDKSIREYSMSSILRWEPYSVTMVIREHQPAPEDPDRANELRTINIVEEDKRRLDSTEERFAKRILNNLYRKIGNDSREKQVKFATDRSRMFLEVGAALLDPEVHESNDPKAFSKFCATYGIKDQNEFMTDVRDRFIACACTSSWHKGGRKRNGKSKYAKKKKQLSIASSMEGGDDSRKVLEDELIGCSLFGYVRNACYNAWNCKSKRGRKVVRTCDIPKTCYGHGCCGKCDPRKPCTCHSDVSSACSSSSSSSSSCSGTDSSDSSDGECCSSSSGDEVTHHASHRRNCGDVYQKYFAPYHSKRSYDDDDCSSSSSDEDDCRGAPRVTIHRATQFCGKEEQDIGVIIAPVRTSGRHHHARKTVGEKDPLDEVFDAVEGAVASGAKGVGKGAKIAGKHVKKVAKKVASASKKKKLRGTETTDIGASLMEEQMFENVASLSGADMIAMARDDDDDVVIGDVLVDAYSEGVEPMMFSKVRAPVHVQGGFGGTAAAAAAPTADPFAASTRMSTDHPIGGVLMEDEDTAPAFNSTARAIPPMPLSVPLVSEEEADDSANPEVARQCSNFMGMFDRCRVGALLEEKHGDRDFVVFAPSNKVFTKKLAERVQGHRADNYGYTYSKEYVCKDCDNGGDFDSMAVDQEGVASYKSIGSRLFALKGDKVRARGGAATIQVHGQFFHPTHGNIEFVVCDALHNQVPEVV